MQSQAHTDSDSDDLLTPVSLFGPSHSNVGDSPTSPALSTGMSIGERSVSVDLERNMSPEIPIIIDVPSSCDATQAKSVTAEAHEANVGAAFTSENQPRSQSLSLSVSKLVQGGMDLQTVSRISLTLRISNILDLIFASAGGQQRRRCIGT